MSKSVAIISPVVLSLAAAASIAEGPAADSPAEPPAPITVTYTVRGMHCQPCANVLAGSLRKTKGIRGAKVDWRTRQARVEIDEAAISIAAVARAMATTPHMMGTNMRYGGSLVLKAPALKDEASAQAATEALGQVPGVAQVTPWIKQHAVTIRFTDKADVTVRQLQDALAGPVPAADNKR